MGYPHHKKLIFKGLQYFFINRKPEKYNTITPNSGRPPKNNEQGDIRELVFRMNFLFQCSS